MNDCLPEWDVAGGDIDVAMHSVGSIPPNRGRWDLASQRKCGFPERAYSPDNELEELCWDNGQLLVVTSSLDGKVHKQKNWHSNSAADFPTSSETESAFAFARLQNVQKVGPLEAPASDLGNVAGSSACDAYMQEVEIPWLHYPLDEPLEKFCSEFVSNSLNRRKDHARCDTDEHGENVNVGSIKAACSSLSGWNLNPGGTKAACNRLLKPMIMDKDSTKELISLPDPQVAIDPHFPNRAATSKREDSRFARDSGKEVAMFNTANRISPALGSSMSQMLLPKTIQGATISDTSVPTTRASRNFSHFSKPAIEVKERIQMLSMAARPTETQRFEQLDKVVAKGYTLHRPPEQPVLSELNLQPSKCRATQRFEQLDRVVAEDYTLRRPPEQPVFSELNLQPSKSSATQRFEQLDRVVAEGYTLRKPPEQPVLSELKLQPSKSSANLPLDAANSCHKVDAPPVQQCVQSISCTEDSDLKLQAGNVTNQSVNREPSPNNRCGTSSGVLRTEKKIGLIEGSDPTATASSGGSGNSVVRNEKAARNAEKRKSQNAVDSECQSKGPVEGRAHGKKSVASQSSSIKRSRAAEIHNQSERRRRDRINEKLKALQELIPNSNKTDKASLLEEAIEYLKMLQMQLQMMAFRSGMTVSPMLIPPGIQHLQMSNMAALPQMHMGLGMGMGMLDMGAATSRHVVALPPFPGFSIPGSAGFCNSAMTPQGHVVTTIPGPVLPAAVISSQSSPNPAVTGLSAFKTPEDAPFHTSMRDNSLNQPRAHTQANCKTAGALLT